MNLKKLKIIGVIMAFFLAFPLHFLYDKAPSFITSIIAPVNESIIEHMKILFGSILASGVIQKIIVKIKHLSYKNICISNIIAGVCSVPIFLFIYLPIYYTIGEFFPLTIFIMFIVIIISQVITYYITNKNKDLKMENLAVIFVILIYISFGLLTYFPPKVDLFKDPLTGYYGRTKVK